MSDQHENFDDITNMTGFSINDVSMYSPSLRTEFENSAERDELDDDLKAITLADFDLSGDETKGIEGLTRKELTAIKVEEKRLKEAANLTFQPKIPSSPMKREENLPTGSRFDKLYDDAIKRRINEDKERSPADNSCTFHPKISRSPSTERRASSPSNVVERLYRTKSTGNGQLPTKEAAPRQRMSGSSSGVNERLYHMSKDIKHKMEQRKIEADEKAKMIMEKECTFAPKINSRPLSAGCARKSTEGPIVDRLLRYDEQKKLRLEGARKALLEKEAAEVTFQPHVNSKRSTTPNRQGNIFERLATPNEVKPSFDPDATFKPQLVTRRPSTPTQEIIPVHERLFLEAERRKITKEVEAQHLQEEELKDATFTPQFVSTRSLAPENPKPVFDRLSSVADRQQIQNILMQIRTDMEMRECTFQPNVAATSLRVDYEEAPVHVRLNSDADRLRDDLRRKAEAQEQEELKAATFAPAMNKKSVAMASRRRCSSPGGGGGGGGAKADGGANAELFQRLNAEAEHFRLNAKKKADDRLAEEQRAARPQINRVSESIARRRGRSQSPSGGVHDRLNSEAEKMRERLERRATEIRTEEEMALTFVPTLISARSAAVESVEEVHIRLNAEADRLRESLKSKADSLLAEEMRSLTFAPMINSKSATLVHNRAMQVAEKEGSDGMADSAAGGAEDVHSRLFSDAERLRREMKKREDDAKREASARAASPSMNSRSAAIVSRRNASPSATRIRRPTVEITPTAPQDVWRPLPSTVLSPPNNTGEPKSRSSASRTQHASSSPKVMTTSSSLDIKTKKPSAATPTSGTTSSTSNGSKGRAIAINVRPSPSAPSVVRESSGQKSDRTNGFARPNAVPLPPPPPPPMSPQIARNMAPPLPPPPLPPPLSSPGMKNNSSSITESGGFRGYTKSLQPPSRAPNPCIDTPANKVIRGRKKSVAAELNESIDIVQGVEQRDEIPSGILPPAHGSTNVEEGKSGMAISVVASAEQDKEHIDVDTEIL